MASFKSLLGETLLTKDGEKPTEEVLGGKTSVGIYFSAHWCPPCRGFTPKLAEMYNNSFKEKGMEIVFVSWDKDHKQFDEYFAEQPWVALPFGSRDLQSALNKKYKVSGIPNLVILSPDGEVITKDGRDAVMKDPSGQKYPWIPPSVAEKAKMLLENLGEDLVAKSNQKPIGLYFSAHWCPPCRAFTPKLAEMYKDGLKDNMEIIFVSSDRDQASFDDYLKDMPWLALPFEKRAEKAVLSDLCSVEGIPSLVVINPDGTIVTTDGRSKVGKDPKAENFPAAWLPQPFNDVNDDPGPLNEEQCLISLGDSTVAADAVKSVAQEYFDKAGKDVDSMPLKFFSGPDGGVVSQIRNLMKVTGNKLVLLDIPDDGGYYVCEADVDTVDAVKQFIADVQAKKIERKQLQK